MPIRAPALIFATQMLVACAGDTNAGRTHASPAAIYVPPARLGKGSIIMMPIGASGIGQSRTASLETPDQRPQPPTKAWLEGTWLQSASGDDLSREACNSGTAVTYAPDGTTSFFEGTGRWRLDGEMLTETLTEVHETGTPEMRQELGRASTVRIRRVGPDEAAVLVGQKWETMLRCRPGDIR